MKPPNDRERNGKHHQIRHDIRDPKGKLQFRCVIAVFFDRFDAGPPSGDTSPALKGRCEEKGERPRCNEHNHANGVAIEDATEENSSVEEQDAGLDEAER